MTLLSKTATAVAALALAAGATHEAEALRLQGLSLKWLLANKGAQEQAETNPGYQKGWGFQIVDPNRENTPYFMGDVAKGPIRVPRPLQDGEYLLNERRDIGSERTRQLLLHANPGTNRRYGGSDSYLQKGKKGDAPYDGASQGSGYYVDHRTDFIFKNYERTNKATAASGIVRGEARGGTKQTEAPKAPAAQVKALQAEGTPSPVPSPPGSDGVVTPPEASTPPREASQTWEMKAAKYREEQEMQREAARLEWMAELLKEGSANVINL